MKEVIKGLMLKCKKFSKIENKARSTYVKRNGYRISETTAMKS